MEFPVPAYTSFTIPTGATSGARITFNEDGSGEIRVYNSAGVLTDTIGGAFGQILVNGAYAGNADSRLVGGEIEFGTAPGFDTPARIHSPAESIGTGLFLDSGSLGAVGDDMAVLTIYPGHISVVTGDANAPYIAVTDFSASSDADIHVSGSVIATNVNDTTLETWNAPSYAANWSAGNIFSGLGGDGLKYRRGAEDDFWLQGLAKAAAGAGTTVFTLPAGYRPVAGGNFPTPHGIVHRERAGVVVTVEVAVPIGGQVILGAPVNAGDVYSFNLRLPRNNVQ
jgi:hypothetical protein